DHHPYGDRVADIALVDETASSTAEITYGLIRATGVSELTPRVAEALFVGILTDTGSFRFPNTTPQTLRVAADLMEAGADPSRVANHLYEQHTLDRMKLLGHELLTCHAVEDTRIAWMEITRE
ncbi:MAG: bifunctional oligoribonuclease/PAP phosphatase NrnA, partial [Anaerolineae bacterium]|nr:bifunctional oligoribonuclease/PAP phosphatase NrnA [Anaerolineae bacterium]NIQ82668.1 bifunctional oligoribonuclease/PAP phosphatase NrnA [Anaerolineae bacterium]